MEKAQQTQIMNIQTKTGKSLEELFTIIKESGLEKHNQIRELLKKELDIGFGDANMLVHVYKKSLEDQLPPEDELENSLTTIYSGSKESLRPLHDAVMNEIHKLGDFEISPKKTYLSLRRKKQFTMVGPGTKNRLEIGLNMKEVPATERLQEQAPGGMCQYKVWLTGIQDINDELIGWIRTAYESAA
jgi:hypothetical protein